MPISLHLTASCMAYDVTVSSYRDVGISGNIAEANVNDARCNIGGPTIHCVHSLLILLVRVSVQCAPKAPIIVSASMTRYWQKQTYPAVRTYLFERCDVSGFVSGEWVPLQIQQTQLRSSSRDIAGCRVSPRFCAETLFVPYCRYCRYIAGC